MKASYSWMREFVPAFQGTPQELADLLTFSGTEVESVEPAEDDHVLELGVTSNRVDCLGHLGLARELSALTSHPLEPPKTSAAMHGPPTGERLRLTVEEPELCPRYTARILEGVTVEPSPDWLQARLLALGQRPVNNVVDITNYVMLELNQPLHAFDLDKLEGQAIVVRRARAQEKLLAINGSFYDLLPEDLVIADAALPVALAGVMGGKATEVGEGTTRVLLEAAWFHPPAVRITSRRLQVFSDSSFRFERGIDRSGVLDASERAARLMIEICGGTLLPEPLDAGGDGKAPASIAFRPSRIDRICGISVPDERATGFLRALGCTVVADRVPWSVTPPTYRGDLTREIDLVEEVIRLHGFDKVPAEVGMPVRICHAHPRRTFRDRIRDRLVAQGFLETVTPNFVGEGLSSQVALLGSLGGIVIQNPVRSGEGALRRSLLPSLLRVRKVNQDQGTEDVRLFEISNLHFHVPGGHPMHLPALGLMVDGDFRDVRGTIEELLRHLGLQAAWERTQSDFLDARALAKIHVDGRSLGMAGYPSAHVLKDAGLKVCPIFAELDLEALVELSSELRMFKGLSRFPAVVRDLSLELDDARSFGELEALVLGSGLSHLKSVEFLDEYRGSQLGKGKKSLAFRMVFRSTEGTLTSEVVDQQMRLLAGCLEDRLGATVRGT